MGERAGYRVREKDKVSPILRKQWYIGDDEEVITELITEIAKTLSKGYDKELRDINDGMSALRNDLDIGRLTMAFYSLLYNPPFDSMEFDTDCDIYDHGLYELELIKWNHWKFWNIHIAFAIDYNEKLKDMPEELKKSYDEQLKKDGTKYLLAEVKFTKDKSLEDGMEIKYEG